MLHQDQNQPEHEIPPNGTIVPRLTVACFIGIAGLFLAYCIPITLQGTKNLRMITAFQWDESAAVVTLLKMLKNSSLDPAGFFNYGAIYFYFNYFVLRVAENIFLIPSTAQTIIIALRMTNTVFALLSGWGLLILARKMYDLPAATLAGLFLITTPHILFWATTAHPDILQMFFIIISVYFCSRLAEAGYSRKDLGWSTVFAGLAFGTKYSGIFLLPVICLAAVWPGITQEEPVSYPRLFYRIFKIGILFLAVFFVTNPYALINFKLFYYTARYESLHVNLGHWSKGEQNPLLWLQVLGDEVLLGSVGLGLFFIYLLSAAIEWIKQPEKRAAFKVQAISLGWVLFFLVYLMIKVNYRPPRYLFPVLPFIYIFIAAAITGLFHNRYQVKLLRSLGQVAALGVLAILLWPKLRLNYDYFDKSLHKVENSLYIAAGEYLERNFPPDTKIIYDVYSYIPPAFKNAAASWGQNESLVNKLAPDIIVTNNNIISRYKRIKKENLAGINPGQFESSAIFYGKLENNRLPSYRKIKDFGEVRIYRRF